MNGLRLAELRRSAAVTQEIRLPSPSLTFVLLPKENSDQFCCTFCHWVINMRKRRASEIAEACLFSSDNPR